MNYNRVHLPPKVWRDIMRHALSREDAEVCGLLSGIFIREGDGDDSYETAFIHEFRPITNIFHSPATFFRMDPYEQKEFYDEAHDIGKAVVGCFHTHPFGMGIPSEIDRQAINEDYAWLIFGGQDNRLQAWWPVDIDDEGTKRFRGALFKSTY